MDRSDVLKSLEYILAQVLTSKEVFAQGNHFLSRNGNSLPPKASSLFQAASRCVGGAAIQAVSDLGFNKNADSDSVEYNAVMEALAETLNVSGASYKKIHAVQRYNNKHGFEEVRLLVQQTIERLKAELNAQS